MFLLCWVTADPSRTLRWKITSLLCAAERGTAAGRTCSRSPAPRCSRTTLIIMRFCFNFYLAHRIKYPNKTAAEQVAAIDKEYSWLRACNASCKLHCPPASAPPSGWASTSTSSAMNAPLSSKDFSLYSTKGPADQAADQAAVPAANQAAAAAAVPPPAVAYYSYSDYEGSQSEEEPASWEPESDHEPPPPPPQPEAVEYSEDFNAGYEQALQDYGLHSEAAPEVESEAERSDYSATDYSEPDVSDGAASAADEDDEFWREEFAMYNF